MSDVRPADVERALAASVGGRPPRASISITSRSSIGCVRNLCHAGSVSTGIRSTRRTSSRNERERAPITIEARSATRVGDRLQQDALDLLAARQGGARRVARSGRCAGRCAPSGGRGRRGTRSGARPAARGGGGEVLRRRRARARANDAIPPARAPSSGSGSRRPRHRRAPASSPSPRDGVAATRSRTLARGPARCARAPRAAVAVAPERAHHVAVRARRGASTRADEAAGAGDQDLASAQMMTRAARTRPANVGRSHAGDCHSESDSLDGYFRVAICFLCDLRDWRLSRAVPTCFDRCRPDPVQTSQRGEQIAAWQSTQEHARAQARRAQGRAVRTASFGSTSCARSSSRSRARRSVRTRPS